MRHPILVGALLASAAPWLSSIGPNLAVLLLALGGLLICIEFNAPGTVLPGAAGLFLVLLAAFSLGHMHLRPSALVLLLVAALLLIADIKLLLHGVAASAGIAALVVGLAHLVAGDTPQQEVSWSVAAGAGVGFGVIAVGLATLGEQARRAKVLTGAQAMVGSIAEVQTPLAPTGQVLVRGEIWQATLAGGSPDLTPGAAVRVINISGLTLLVEPVATP